MDRMRTSLRILALCVAPFVSASAHGDRLKKVTDCETRVSAHCVKTTCPAYCKATSKDDAPALDDCKKHCTLTDYCRLHVPGPKHDALEELVWTEVQACVHDENPSHEVTPPARAKLPSNEPPFKLKRITPVAGPAVPKAAPKAAPPQAKPAPKAETEDEPHWDTITTPSWRKLVGDKL